MSSVSDIGNISNKMVKGAVWMVGFKIVERSIGLISTIILARLLAPGDFGLVAMANTFLSLLLLLTSFSFDVALIQKQDAARDLYDTAWTFNVIFGALLAILLMISAIPLAQFYNENRLEQILYVLAFSTLFAGFSNIGPVAFRKNLQFHKEFYFLLAKKIMGFTVCMAFAFTMRNYWALVWGTFAGRILEVFLSYRVHSYRPRFSLRGTRELFGFSMWLFLNNTISFTYNRLADFFISKMIGVHSLGIYTVAYEISNLPTTELVAPINRAVFPGYSKMANDLFALRQGFLNVLAMIALCSVPAGVGIAMVAKLLVIVVLGDKWQEAIPLVQILAFSGVLMALQTNTSVIYNALGKPRYMAYILIIHVFVIFLPMLVYLLQKEHLLGVAKAYLFSNIIILPINYFVTMKLICVKPIKIISVVWRPILAALFMYYAAHNLAIEYVENILSNKILYLLVYVFLGVFVYSISIIFLWIVSHKPDGVESYMLKKIGLYAAFN